MKIYYDYNLISHKRKIASNKEKFAKDEEEIKKSIQNLKRLETEYCSHSCIL